MLAELGEERPFGAVGRGLGEAVESEITPLEPALPEIAPFRKEDRQTIGGAHFHGIAVDEVLRKHEERGVIQIVRRIEVQASRRKRPASSSRGVERRRGAAICFPIATGDGWIRR